MLQLPPTLSDPVDCSLPGSSVRGVLQARTLEWAAVPSSRGLPTQGWGPSGVSCIGSILHQLRHGVSALSVHSQCSCCCCCVASVVSDSVTPWTVACQTPLPMGFSRQGYWSGLPCPPPGDLPSPGVKPRSPTLKVDSLPAEPQGKLKNIGVGSLSLLQQIFPTQGEGIG